MSMKNRAGLIKIIGAIESVKQCLSCAICLEISSDPVETRCGHLFCRSCIKKALDHPSDSCPVCKTTLTRRSFSPSHQMKKCIRQMSKLSDAIRNDTGIDVTSCLQMRYEKSTSLPSVSTSSKRSSQEKQNHAPFSELDNNNVKEPKNLIGKPADLRSSQENKLRSKDPPTRASSSIDIEALCTKPIRSTNAQRNVVPFKKRGHLFKSRRKCVVFLYRGAINQPGSKFYGVNDFPGVCEICWSSVQSQELRSIENIGVESDARSNKIKSVESPGAMKNRFENVRNSPNRIEPALCAARSPNSRTSVDHCTMDDSESRPAKEKSILTPIVTTETVSLDQWETFESSIVKRKRKRPQSPDQLSRSSKKMSFSEIFESSGQDCLTNKITPLQNVVPRSDEAATSKTREINTPEISEATKNKNLTDSPGEIDFWGTNSSQRSNATLRTQIPKSPFKRVPDGSKIGSTSGARSAAVEKNVGFRASDDDGRINLSQDSNMNITAEELLWKEFELNLFRPESSQNRGRRVERDEKEREDEEDVFDGREKNNADASAMEDVLSPEPLEQSVLLPETALTENLESEKIDEPRENPELGELLTTERRMTHSEIPTKITRNQDIAAARPNVEPRRIDQQKPSVTIPSPEPNSTQPRTRPKIKSSQKSPETSSKQEKIDQSSSNTHRQKEADTTFSEMKIEYDANPSSSDREVPRIQQGCVICSGLTTRQSEDVRRFSSLFNMRYTKKFTDDVTHVIVKTNDQNNGAFKTLKYLQGIAYKKWVLSFDWIVDCVEELSLLKEDNYEAVDGTSLIPGPRKARTGEKSPFRDFVFFCVEPFQSISVPDYEDLLLHTGAIVVGSLNELADHPSILKIIVVQADKHDQKIIEWHQASRAVPVAQEWIFECISQYQLVTLLPFLQELVAQDVLDLGFPEALVQDE